MVHTGPKIDTNSRKNVQFGSAERNVSLGSNFMMPGGVYSVQPLSRVGQTPSPKPREDLTMGDEIVGMHTWVWGTYYCTLQRSEKDVRKKVRFRSMHHTRSSDV
jgi:hypothetical protein